MVLQNIKRYTRKGLLAIFLATAFLAVGANGVANGQAQEDDLGNFRGHKWNDVNGNGLRDEADDASFNLNGWTINLYSPDGDDDDSAWDFEESVVTGHTNNWGVFSFTGYPWGTYYVCEVPQDGWQQTWPLPTGGRPLVEDPYAPGQYCYVAIIQDGNTDDEREINLNFGNQVIPDDPEEEPANGRIRGAKFNDLNGNGVQDPGEHAMNNWMMNLYDSSWNYLESAETGVSAASTGHYRFEGLEWGTYYICEVMQEGWTQTRPFDGSDRAVANLSPNATDEGEYCLISILSYGPTTPGSDTDNERDINMDFGNTNGDDEQEPDEETDQGQIRVHLVIDADEDGFPDWLEGETHQAGWTIRLYGNAWGPSLDEVVTTGLAFDDSAMFIVDPGEYIICMVEQEGYEQTFARTITSWVTFPDTSIPNLSGASDEGNLCIPVEVTESDFTSHVFGAAEDGEVQGDTDENPTDTNDDDGNVLGDTDEDPDTNGEVLAETGVGSLPYLVIGALLVLAPTALAVRARKQD